MPATTALIALATLLASAPSTAEPARTPGDPPREPVDPAGDSWLWNAPPQCPTSEAVRAELDALLADIPASARPPWRAAGVVTHDATRGYAVALMIETPDGRHDRLLTDPSSCDAVSTSAALLIALALSPDADSPPEPDVQPEPEPEPKPEPAAKPPQDAPRPTSEPAPDLAPRGAGAAEPNPEPLTFTVGLAPGFDWGTLRGVTPHSQLALGWQPRSLRVGLAAHFGGNPAFDLPPLTEKVRLWRWSLAAAVGPVPKLGRFEFPMMAGLEVGQVLLTPSALLPRSSQTPWAAVLVTPGVTWVAREGLALTAQASTAVAFSRPRFEVEGLDPILESSRVGIRAYLGIEFRVPLLMKTD